MLPSNTRSDVVIESGGPIVKLAAVTTPATTFNVIVPPSTAPSVSVPDKSKVPAGETGVKLALCAKGPITPVGGRSRPEARLGNGEPWTHNNEPLQSEPPLYPTNVLVRKTRLNSGTVPRMQ